VQKEDGADMSEDSPIKLLWQKCLNLYGPTNVVIGRMDGEAVFCIQGVRRNGDCSEAAIEVRKSCGNTLWENSHGTPGLNYGVGAYVQWIDGPGIGEPMIAYSFVPPQDECRGGLRLNQARDGELIKEIENTTRFGNNNSIVADIDGDGKTELVCADQSSLTCYELPSCKLLWSYDDGVMFCWGLPALSDADEDGHWRIIFGSEYNNADGSSSMIAIDCYGHQVWRSDGYREDLGSTPVFIADVDDDGMQEYLKVGLDLEHRQQQDWNNLFVFDTEGQLKSTIELGFTGIAIGDIDGDGHLEGIGLTNTRDGGSNGQREVRCIDLTTGRVKWKNSIPRAYLDTNSPVMADINGDGRLEAVVGTGNPSGYGRLPDSQPWGDIYVFDSAGNRLQHICLPGWPVNFALCDINDDGLGELAVVIDGTPGWLALFQTRLLTTRRDWPTPFGNAARSGTMSLESNPNQIKTIRE
jgi:hypothetical protein